MLPALTALLLLQLVGEVLARWFQWPVPGPVVGMALALLGLRLYPGGLAKLRPTAQGLLGHLSLLFVPAGVGVMLHLRRLGDEALAIGVALVLSTWISMAVTAWVATWLMRWAAPPTSPPSPSPVFPPGPPRP
jgi:holin-like protein